MPRVGLLVEKVGSVGLRRVLLTAMVVVVSTVAVLGMTGCNGGFSGFKPGISAGPLSVTVTAPATATFSVVATGTGPLGYQWTKNGTPIVGARGTSYTTPATGEADNGALFAVTVTNVNGSVTSAPATLTVITTPVATSLVCSSAAPTYNTAITVTPTWSGESAVIGSAGPGSSDITAAAVSGTAYATPKLTAATTYTLTVTGSGGATATTSCSTTPTPVTVSAIAPANSTVTATTPVTFVATATGGATDALSWTATGGTFSGSVWTPPAVNGTYAITATSVDEPSAHVSTTVTVNLEGAPTITTQPVGAYVCANQAVSLSVAATGATGYQWDFNGAPITGATEASYSIASAQPAQSGSYTCVVSNATAGVLSSPANVLVGSTITTNPADVTVYASQVGTFTVAATGEPAYTYQWYKIPPGGGAAAAITGATTASYITPVTTSADSGTQFYATVKDACGTTYTSATATMTVATGNVPPTITTQPASQAVASGSTTVTFTAAASGTPTISYQWYWIPAGQQTGSAVQGATSASYTVPSSATTTENNEDQYYVIATNAYGQASSQNASLVVDNGILLAISGEPVSQYVNVGQGATFTVAASSTAPLTYQWYEAAPGSSTFAPVTGATSASYTVSDTTTAMYGSVLYVVVSNGSSSVTSTTAGLYVGPLNGVGDLCDPGWLPHGSAVEVVGPGTDNCSFEVTNDLSEAGQVVWPQLIATGNLQLNFTITLSNATPIPADGFTVTLGDPSQGATATSLGSLGQGLGAEGIPGFVLGFDTYQNGYPDAPIVPYVGVTRGNEGLFENPWFNYNDNIGTIVEAGETIVNDYVVTLVHGQMTVTQNGKQIFSGAVTAVPPVAYLYVTASTGGLTETVDISNMTVVVSTP